MKKRAAGLRVAMREAAVRGHQRLRQHHSLLQVQL